MPRIRTIKPEFWTDEKVVELSPWARLLYIALWNFSDDNGVVENKPKQIKMRVFPADDLKIDPLIDELVTHHLVESYEVDGDKFLCCKNLRKHQIIDKPRKSNLPKPPQSVFNRNQLKSTEISLGREGKGREEEGKRKRKGREGKAIPPPSGDAQPVYSCLHFEISRDHFAAILADFPQFPEEYLLIEFFPRMRDWCSDHFQGPKHSKKFNGPLLKNVRSCFRNWLKNEDSGKAAPYCRPKPPPPLPADPPGMQSVFDPDCPACRGSGRYRDGPCSCGKLEPIVDPDPKCHKCGGRGITKDGPCECLKPRIIYESQAGKPAAARTATT